MYLGMQVSPPSQDAVSMTIAPLQEGARDPSYKVVITPANPI